MARNTSGLLRGGPGRPKGVPNKATVEAQEACAKLVDDRIYRSALKKRLLAGRLAPAVETMLWHYAYGKPKERHEHTGADGGPISTLNVADLSDETIRRILADVGTDAPESDDSEG